MLNIEEAAAAKLKAEEDAAKEKLDCFLVAGLLYFSASDLLRMGMCTAQMRKLQLKHFTTLLQAK